MPQGLLNPFCFPEILKANLDNIKFPRVYTLLKYVANFLLCSPSQAFSQENIIPLQLLVLKGHKFTKGRLVCPNQDLIDI